MRNNPLPQATKPRRRVSDDARRPPHHCHEFDDKELAHIKGCEGLAEAWRTLCTIHKTKNLSSILFLRRKFFAIKMDKSDDILEHINKVKSLADQLTCLEVPMKDKDVVMTLLDSLPPSFEHLITALETWMK